MRYLQIALLAAALAVVSGTLYAQQAPENTAADASQSTTVRGCLRGERGNYILIEDKTGSVYVLKGVGNKLDNFRRHEVEAKGRILPGTIKTGIRPEKAGSNPADTVHSVDGVPFQVGDPKTDVRIISKKCIAADQQQ